MDQYNKDLLAIREHPNQESLMADTALYNRLIDYNKRDMLPSAEIKAILERTPLPENSRSKVVSDSLRKESEKPIVETKPEPVKKSAGEAILQALAPRLTDRSDRNVQGVGGTLAAGGLDLLSLPARVLNTVVHGPVDTYNALQQNTPPVDALKNYLSTIGDISGESFNTPNLPKVVDENFPTVANFVHSANPIAEGIGEFGTSIARGPIIPGAALGSGATKLGILGNVLKNAGIGGVLGTSESVARGEGFDPTGTAIGSFIGGGLPLVGKGVVAGGRYLSDRKTGNILLDAQHEKINRALANLNLTQAELSRAETDLANAPRNPKFQEKVSDLTSKTKTAQKNYEKVSKQSPSGQNSGSKTREYWEKHPDELAQMYKTGLDIKASDRGYIGNKPTSLMDALEIYSPNRNPIIPMPEAENAVYNLGAARKASNAANQELERSAAAGKLGMLFRLYELLGGESYIPEKIINPIARNLPDASYIVPPMIRATTPLQTYFSQDSTKR